MSVAAFAFLSFNDTGQLLPAVESIRAVPGLLYWHAIEGQYQLAVALDTAGSASALHTLNSLSGLKGIRVCRVVEQLIPAAMLSPENIHAYIVMDTIPGMKDRLLYALSVNGGPQWGMLAGTECGFVGVLSASGFEAVDRIIETSVRTLDGVLRLHRDWIIDLTQL